MPECSEGCGHFDTIQSLRRHWMDEHSGKYETPDEYLGGNESEQRDFAGEEPSTDGHNPEYETLNDPDDGEKTRLSEWTSGKEGEQDDE